MHPSTNLLQKYFPDLHHPSKKGDDFFYPDFSDSAFSSAIIRKTHVQKTRVLLPFANVGRLASLRDVSKEEEASNGCVAESAMNSIGKNSWSEMPKFLLAGAVSTIVSRTFVAPLERIKLECVFHGPKFTWIRAIQWIWATEGLTGFWKGNVLNLFRMVPFKSINFICYDMYCDRLFRIRGAKKITNNDRLIGGGISGITATILCLPLDTIRTRILAPGGETLGGVVGCCLHMIHNEGFLSLYKGLTPALISMGPSCAVFYLVYDILKTSYLSQNNSSSGGGKETELGVMRMLTYGAVSGACAETVTYPLEVIRRHLQLDHKTRINLVTAFVKLIERDGVASLFAGLIPSMLQVLPSASLSYLFYEMMKSVLKIN